MNKVSFLVIVMLLIYMFTGCSTQNMLKATEKISSTTLPADKATAEISKTSNNNSDQPRIDSIYMIDETTGWALNSGKIIRTTNGCEDWEDVTPTDNAFYPLINGPDGIGA